MKKYPLVYVFFIILFGFTMLDMVGKDKKFSEVENRNLKQEVRFTVKGFIDGTYSSKYEEYINDQFMARDMWIDLKSRSEYVLGKIENNGIIYGKDKYLFEKFKNLNEERLSENVEAIKCFSESYGEKLSTVIVPSSYEVYDNLLPEGTTVINQEEYITNIYSNLEKGNKIELLSLMKDNRDKYIYYKTDHHWTTYGAFLAYEKLMDTIGEEPKELWQWGNAIDIYDFYGTYFSKAKPFNGEGDILSYYDLSNLEMYIEKEKYNSIYDDSYFKTRDKYSAFLRGNNALTIIKSKEITNGKKILVIKDSFANSLVPFLTGNFQEIHIIDLRAFMPKLSTYVEENQFNNIVILYNFINLARDTNMVKLKF